MARTNLQYLIGQEIKEPEKGTICGYTASENFPVTVYIHYVAADGDVKTVTMANIKVDVPELLDASELKDPGERPSAYSPFGPRG